MGGAAVVGVSSYTASNDGKLSGIILNRVLVMVLTLKRNNRWRTAIENRPFSTKNKDTTDQENVLMMTRGGCCHRVAKPYNGNNITVDTHPPISL